MTFTDSTGTEWHPRLTTPVLLKLCRNENITLGAMMKGDVNAAVFVEALWYACEKQADELGIKHDQFIERIGLDKLPQVVECIMMLFADSFPAPEGGQSSGPFENGKSRTSGNFADWLRSVQVKTAHQENSGT